MAAATAGLFLETGETSKLVLAVASTVILGSAAHGTRVHVFRYYHFIVAKQIRRFLSG
jgi:hypothetical protein